MSHRFYEGEIFHKRYAPKVHQFTYDYFFLDIDVAHIDTLHNGIFSTNGLNLMSFYTKDHFGDTNSFAYNAHALINALGWGKPHELRFITLPRMANFVFNPISMLLLLDNKCRYAGNCPKTMYVSPFMGYEGHYHFTIEYTEKHFGLIVELHVDNRPLLLAHFSGSAKPFTTSSIRSLLCAHTFLTFFVVTRTLWQTLRLKLKGGLTWHSPRTHDQIHKEIV